MEQHFLNLFPAFILVCIIHEGGHYLAALVFGRKLSFRFEWGKLFGVIPIPRWTWTMPIMAEWKQRVVAVAGFGVEFLCAGVCVALGWLWLLLVAFCHIIIYPFYAGENSDFNWL